MQGRTNVGTAAGVSERTAPPLSEDEEGRVVEYVDEHDVGVRGRGHPRGCHRQLDRRGLDSFEDERGKRDAVLSPADAELDHGALPEWARDTSRDHFAVEHRLHLGR